jgi:iron complex outermembrane receptor protein
LASCDPNAPLSLQFPGGLHARGSNAGAQPQRPWNGTPNVLGPERSTNITVGFDFVPTYLPGLNLGATYWKATVNDFIFNPGTRVGGPLTNPATYSLYSFPDEPEFAQALQDSIELPFADFNPALIGNITYMLDAADRNVGTFKVEGIDFHGGYDLDMANWGVWRAGISGSYYINHVSESGFDAPISLFDNNGVPNKARPRWRSYLGWLNDSYSATLFANFMSHYFHMEGSPPAATLAACGCDYSNYMPNYLTWDLALGYNTLEMFTNPYLHNLNLQFVVNNLFDNHAPFAYYLSRTGAYDSLQPFDPVGRRFSLTLTKTW